MSLKKECSMHYKSLAKAYMTRNVYWMKNVLIGIIHSRVATEKSPRAKTGKFRSRISFPGIELRIVRKLDGLEFKIDRLECSNVQYDGKTFDEGAFFCVIERYIHDLPSSMVFGTVWEILSRWQPRRDYTWAVKNEVMSFGRICPSKSEKERVIQTSLPIEEKSEVVVAPTISQSEKTCRYYRVVDRLIDRGELDRAEEILKKYEEEVK